MSNTSTTIVTGFYAGHDRGGNLNWNPGDGYEITKCLRTLDQAGLGKGDLLKNVKGVNKNTRTNTQIWPRQINEPSVSYNNVHLPQNIVLGIGSAQEPTFIEGRDYINLGNGFPTTGAPQQVKDVYTAAVNGVQYTGPYTYPHPLQSGFGTPSPTPIASPSPTRPLHLRPRRHRARPQQRPLR